MIEYVGLFFEVLFFLIGLYVYMLSRGLVKVQDPSLAKQFHSLKKRYGVLIRIISLALTAVMFMNIVLHIKALWA